MRNFISVIAATLGLSLMFGSAGAEDLAAVTGSAPLGMVIAAQGDNALIRIRTDMADAISKDVRQQMAASLTQDTVGIEPCPAPGETEVAVLAAPY